MRHTIGPCGCKLHEAEDVAVNLLIKERQEAFETYWQDVHLPRRAVEQAEQSDAVAAAESIITEHALNPAR